METPIIRSVDHIMVRVKTAEPLFELFSRTLALPVSWPLQISDFATFGWVTVGNANLEFWAAADNSDLPGDSKLPGFHGFALEPSNLAASLSRLAERGIACKAPRPFITKKTNGEEALNFTNAVIRDVSTDGCCIFFCEWCPNGSIFPWTDRLSTPQRREREKAQLLALGGGPLGITGLLEIQIEAPPQGKFVQAWQTLTEQGNQVVYLADGVQLRFLPSSNYRISALVLGVQSVRNARDFLIERRLLESEDQGELILSRKATDGLTFILRERRPADN